MSDVTENDRCFVTAQSPGKKSMPLDLDIKVSDISATIALLISVLSAIYARGQRIAADRANLIAVRESRRPLRLQVFQSMHHFSTYCSKYWTLYHMGEVSRSRELTERIDTFTWEIEQHGHLDMPDVEEKAKAFVNGAWKLQRLVDRIADGQNNPHDREYATAEENVEGLVDWFAKESHELKALFQPYLRAA